MTTLKLAAVVINARDIERVVELGGEQLEQHSIGSFTWIVYADPEGNEFCVAEADPDDYA